VTLISVVVPVYYNAESIPLLLERLLRVADELSENTYEFLFVDDGSGDSSFQVLEKLSQTDKRISILKLSRNFGSNAAVLAGLTYSNGDCVVVIAADLQDPPELIPELVAAWHQNNQVVLAARKKRDDPLVSKLFAKIFNQLFRRFVFKDFPPNGFDFILLDRRVVDILVKLDEKNSYIFGQAMWVGFNRHTLYYNRAQRVHGHSRWTFTKKVKYLIDSFAAFSYLPLRAASLLGFSLATLGFLYTMLIIALRILKNFPVTGWASLTVITLVTSGAQLIIMGVLGEYLWRVLDETRHRPAFIVETAINADIKL
jgi:polyisoprenyl-phosphate glycosyltransferase